MGYSIFYIHVEPYIVGKLGYISQFLTRYWVVVKIGLNGLDPI